MKIRCCPADQMHVNADVGCTRRALHTWQPAWTGLVHPADRRMALAKRLSGNAGRQHRAESSDRTATRNEVCEMSQLIRQERTSAQLQEQ